MSTIFEWEPSDGDAPWGEATRTNYVPAAGCDNAAALTCAPNNGVHNLSFIGKNLTDTAEIIPCYTGAVDEEPLRDITIRVRFGYINFDAGASSALTFLNFSNNTLTSSNSQHFDGSLGVIPNTGALIFNIEDSDAASLSTADGSLPDDGIPHGIQVTLHFIDDDKVDYNVLVDNVSVLTGRATHTTAEPEFQPCFSFWGSPWECALPEGQGPCYQFIYHAGVTSFSITNFRYPAGTCPAESLLLMSTTGRVEVDNTVAVIDFDVCAATPISIATCDCPPPFFDGLTVDCETEFLHITGQHLTTVDLDITGPDGGNVLFSVEDASDTEIIVSLFLGFTSGTYCVTIGELSSICATLFCNATVYPLRRSRAFVLPFDQNYLMNCRRMEILIKAGVGNADEPNPTLFIELSRDGGETWSTPRELAMGEAGEYLTRLYSYNWGQYRIGAARVTCSDPVFSGWLEFYATLDEGTKLN